MARTITDGQRDVLKRLFIECFSAHGSITAALSDMGEHRVSRQTIYSWQEHDEQFAASFNTAAIESTERLEREAYRRACEGTLTKKFKPNGDPIIDPETDKQYIVREYSDELLRFLLGARRPDVYRQRYDVRMTKDAPMVVPMRSEELDAV